MRARLRAREPPHRAILIVVPIPRAPLEASAKWLDTELSRKELKALAERRHAGTP